MRLIQKEVRIEIGDAITGKKIREVENEYGIKIVQLENYRDRILPFSWERLPHNRIIRTADTLTVSGKKTKIDKFCKVAS